jgi:GTP cyclohydrolase II
MALRPSTTELIARARADLRIGLPVILLGGGGPALALSAETLSAARLAEARAAGAAVVALTARRATTLRSIPYDGALARIVLPPDADLAWVQALADPADDLAHPMKGPLSSRRDGPADVHGAAIALCKSARLLPAALVVAPLDAAVLADCQALTTLASGDIVDMARLVSPLREVVSARLPTAAAGDTRLRIFRPEDGSEEHYAIEVGRPDRARPVLTRLHSACFTGDLLGSLKCDCGPQLRGAMTQMGAEGSGVLLYLNQEGRGIGLANKMRAYALQDQGFDTVEANHRLGFEDDERDFRIGAQILRRLGFGSARLMTNNPAKVAMLQANGIAVTERVPLQVGRGPLNTGYLDTKAAKSGHLL